MLHNVGSLQSMKSKKKKEGKQDNVVSIMTLNATVAIFWKFQAVIMVNGNVVKSNQRG